MLSEKMMRRKFSQICSMYRHASTWKWLVRPDKFRFDGLKEGNVVLVNIAANCPKDLGGITK
jgi:hypothetical protein